MHQAADHDIGRHSGRSQEHHREEDGHFLEALDVLRQRVVGRLLFAGVDVGRTEITRRCAQRECCCLARLTVLVVEDDLIRAGSRDLRSECLRDKRYAEVVGCRDYVLAVTCRPDVFGGERDTVDRHLSPGLADQDVEGVARFQVEVVRHMILDEDGGVISVGEVRPRRYVEPIYRRLVTGRNSNDATEQLCLVDAKSNIGGRPHLNRLDRRFPGSELGNRLGVAAGDGEVGEPVVNSCLVIRGDEIGVRIPRCAEDGDTEEDRDCDCDELWLVPSDVSPQFALQRFHHVRAPASTGESLRMSSTISPERSRSTRSAMSPIAAL